MYMDNIKLICQDALLWLEDQDKLPNIVTGICDLAETQMTHDQYLVFFKKIAKLIFDKLDDDCYAVFIQTNRKHNRRLMDKSYMLSSIADSCGLRMAWHKIVLNRDVDKVDLFRPTYSHMVCYTRNGTSGKATPDVIPISKRGYRNATPILAARRALEFIKTYSKTKAIVDPFVGQGTIPLMAMHLGMTDWQITCIDICPDQIAFTTKTLSEYICEAKLKSQ